VITLALRNDPGDPRLGWTDIVCAMGTTRTAAATTYANKAFSATSTSSRTAAHELGHAQSLMHISSYATALLGNFATGTTTPQALDVELVNTVYP
jgi:hypothetical protein